jgi:hypothetical protein
MSSPIDDSAFKQAVEKFRVKLTPEQAQDFQLTTINDLKSAIAKLQNQQMSERKLRNLKRLESFVLRMGQFEQVVTVYLNASMFVGFVWVSSSALCFCWPRRRRSGASLSAHFLYPVTLGSKTES